MRKERCKVISICLCVCMLAGCGIQDKAFVLTDAYKEDMVTDQTEDIVQFDAVHEVSEQETTPTETNEQMIFVYVCGAVQCPGVVELPMGSRAADALEAAGGLLEEAQPDYVNLAAKLEDAQKLYFPTTEEAILLEQRESVAASGLININTAGVELLCSLPGIGETKAADIVAYREAHGEFQNKEELMKVSGIKQSAYDKLCDKITVE